MNEVLDADDAVAPEGVLDQVVGGDGSPLSVDLDEKCITIRGVLLTELNLS